ncbi:MAG: hypothetical protein ACAF41_00095 (plasmid) [Leptolyngbya sp. BL-A-14]
MAEDFFPNNTSEQGQVAILLAVAIENLFALPSVGRTAGLPSSCNGFTALALPRCTNGAGLSAIHEQVSSFAS